MTTGRINQVAAPRPLRGGRAGAASLSLDLDLSLSAGRRRSACTAGPRPRPGGGPAPTGPDRSARSVFSRTSHLHLPALSPQPLPGGPRSRLSLSARPGIFAAGRLGGSRSAPRRSVRPPPPGRASYVLPATAGSAPGAVSLRRPRPGPVSPPDRAIWLPWFCLPGAMPGGRIRPSLPSDRPRRCAGRAVGRSACQRDGQRTPPPAHRGPPRPAPAGAGRRRRSRGAGGASLCLLPDRAESPCRGCPASAAQCREAPLLPPAPTGLRGAMPGDRPTLSPPGSPAQCPGGPSSPPARQRSPQRNAGGPSRSSLHRAPRRNAGRAPSSPPARGLRSAMPGTEPIFPPLASAARCPGGTLLSALSPPSLHGAVSEDRTKPIIFPPPASAAQCPGGPLLSALSPRCRVGRPHQANNLLSTGLRGAVPGRPALLRPLSGPAGAARSVGGNLSGEGLRSQAGDLLPYFLLFFIISAWLQSRALFNCTVPYVFLDFGPAREDPPPYSWHDKGGGC